MVLEEYLAASPLVQIVWQRLHHLRLRPFLVISDRRYTKCTGRETLIRITHVSFCVGVIACRQQSVCFALSLLFLLAGLVKSRRTRSYATTWPVPMYLYDTHGSFYSTKL